MIRLILFFILLSLNLSYSADYSVDQFIEELLSSHKQKKILQLKKDVTQSEYKQSKGVTDWSIDSSISLSRSEPTSSSSFVADYVESTTYTFGLNRPIMFSGAILGFNFSHQKVKQPSVTFNGISFNSPLYYNSSIGVSIRQPLLYGFGGELLKLPITVASANVERTSLDSEDEFEQFIYNELVSFVNWTLANEVAELTFSRFQLARESYKQTQDRVKVNLAEKIDLLRAEYALENAQQFWQSQNARLKSVQAKFSSRLDNPNLRQVTPQFNLYEMVYIKNPSYIIISNLRRIKSFNTQLIVLQKQLSLHESKRNGDLSLIGNYDFSGDGERFIDSNQLSKNNSSIVLNYQRALSDTDTILKVDEAKKRMEIFELTQSQQTKDLAAEISGLHTLIGEYEVQLDSTLNQIIISQRKADAENELYKQGRSSIDMLIQAQDNVLSSKLNYANLSADYQKAVLLYQTITDNLLKSYGITL